MSITTTSHAWPGGEEEEVPIGNPDFGVAPSVETKRFVEFRITAAGIQNATTNRGIADSTRQDEHTVIADILPSNITFTNALRIRSHVRSAPATAMAVSIPHSTSHAQPLKHRRI
jgi:hypothetical protein